jgi:hypothetical protein
VGAPSVTFNYQQWIGAFPMFSAVSEPSAQNYFDMATLYFNNSGWPGSLPQAPMLLNLLTCHLAWLYAPRDPSGNPASEGAFPPAVVGRISSANQGSVSMQTDFDSNKGSPSLQWYNQSPWGAQYVAATAQFRTAFYVGRRRRVVDGVFPAAPLGWSTTWVQ